MTLSIIIVNYNTKDLLINCIDSIYLHTNNLEYEIIVVDNDSNDGTQQILKEQYSNVQLIESNVNLGFGLANNLGAKKAKGEFIFFLNSDTILIENSIRIMLVFFQKFENDLRIGVLGTVLIDENYKINGFGSHFPICKEENILNLRKIPLVKSFIPYIKKQEYDLTKKYFEIDYVIGADMLMRRSLFEKLNGFSKEFFMYYEESDLQKRVAALGLKRYIITTTKIIHLEDGSGKLINKYSNRKRIIVHKSKNIYLKRNDEKEFLKYFLFDFTVLVLSFFNFKYTFKENLSYFKEIYKTY